MMRVGLGLGVANRGGGEAPPFSVSIGSGSVTTGTLLTVTVNGLVGGEVVTYQWTDDGANITGATAQTYTPTIGVDGVADGSIIRCVATVDGTPYTSSGRQLVPLASALLIEGTSDAFLIEGTSDRIILEAA